MKRSSLHLSLVVLLLLTGMAAVHAKRAEAVRASVAARGAVTLISQEEQDRAARSGERPVSQGHSDGSPPRHDLRRWDRRTPVVEVFESCRDAVVNISTTRTVRVRSFGFSSPFDDFFDAGPRTGRRRVQSIGSGVVIHESGYIVTNAHVVSQASDIHVAFADGDTIPAKVVAVDGEHDLAVLKVDSPQPLDYVVLGRSDDIMVGETVVAIGNPLGLQNTVTAGIVSALNRQLDFDRDVEYKELIQTDASINPGNSGGPLLNVHGELIGINTAIRGDAQNIGFAIPVDRLWELLPEMLNIERYARVRFGLNVSGPQAEVLSVRRDSPAAAAGLKTGDRLLRFDGHPLRDGIDYYVHLLQSKPGDTVRLSLRRGGDDIDAPVTLELIPIPDGNALMSGLLGMSLTQIPDDLRRRYDLPDYIGLTVDSVERGGPAARAGIESGDILLRLDRVSVTNLEEVGLSLEPVQRGQRVIIEGLRVRGDPFLWTVSIETRSSR